MISYLCSVLSKKLLMRRVNLFITMLMLCLAGVLQAQELEPNLKWGKPTDAELTMTSYAPDPDAEAVVLCSQTEMRYDLSAGNFRVTTYEKRRIKVLKENGKSYANGAITYQYNGHRIGHCEELIKLKATAYNLVDGKVVKTKMDNDMISHEDVNKLTRLTKYTVPQVTVGTVIEVETELASDYFTSIDDWHAQSGIPVYYTEFEITVPEYFIFNIDERGSYRLERTTETVTMSLSLKGAVLRCQGQRYRFTGHELPALRKTSMLYAPQSYGQRVSMELRSVDIPGNIVRNFSTSWEDVDKRLLDDEDFGGRLGKNPLKAEMQAAGIASIADPKERAMAIFKLLKDHVKWNGKYTLYAESAGKVLKERTGSNASINFMLINMLNDAGIEAYPAVLRSRDRGFLTVTRASIKELNTCVVALKLGEAYSFLDGSIEDGWLDILPDRLLVDRARILGKGKTSEWVDLTALSGARTQSMVMAQLQPDGTMVADAQSRLTGSEAAILRHGFRMATDSATFVAQLAQELNCEIQSLELAEHQGLGINVGRKMHLTKQCDTAGDMIYLNPWFLNVLTENPLTEEQRTLPVEFPHIATESLNTQITLPEGYVVEEVPQPLTMKSEDGTLSCIIATVFNDGILSSRCQLQVNKIFFTPNEYPVVKNFLDEVYKRLQDVIVIKKAL